MNIVSIFRIHRELCEPIVFFYVSFYLHNISDINVRCRFCVYVDATPWSGSILNEKSIAGNCSYYPGCNYRLALDTVRISCGVSGLSYWQYFRKRRGNMKSETIIY
ncbi:MAG: hypothetical protein PWP49_846, partial [Thermococcaceae archaeon]|nr:hypothetical protein [Thermococcaceae archaeon]